uniref:Glycosyltransferase 61 catalytic domain-containing protein n=1 Tax=Chromera velia CCMP2878 TaxID=1169474 RepID=A0A0G4H2F2_9ALVE|eukprot:Cvel_24370.t1-p1 / transcript=Cvel_24370.t1 / gene=Cvel_24370 / organism=Chromera_velia_CCMP2878 / gene_product=hypothetical protein / transcript_product=hypothetical protein / location=Cvel_scaffold2625:703-2232(-) / protein_length=510 / sequence_SO=supercontig / SO=protein_coding / is_pseudo=false
MKVGRYNLIASAFCLAAVALLGIGMTIRRTRSIRLNSSGEAFKANWSAQQSEFENLCGLNSVGNPGDDSVWCCQELDAESHACWLHNVCINAPKRKVFLMGNGPLPSVRATLRASGDKGSEVKWERRGEVLPSLFASAPSCEAGHWFWLQPYAETNFGHALNDDVFSAFSLLRLFNRTSVASELNVVSAVPEDRDWGMHASVNQWKLMTSGRVVGYDELGSDLLCVENLYVGNSRLGYAQGYEGAGVDEPSERMAISSRGAGSGDGGVSLKVSAPPSEVPVLCKEQHTLWCAELSAFRRHVMKHTGAGRDRSGPLPLMILFVDKGKGEHHRGVENFQETMDAVARTFPTALIEHVPSWDRVSLERQVSLVSRADVMVVISGSDSMTAVWLHQLSELIIICRPEGVGMEACKFDCGNEARIWYREYRSETKTLQCTCTDELEDESCGKDELQCWIDPKRPADIEAAIRLSVDRMVMRVHSAVGRLLERKRVTPESARSIGKSNCSARKPER